MKTITTLFIAAATSIALNANAFDVEILDIGEVFPIKSTEITTSYTSNTYADVETLGIGEVFPLKNEVAAVLLDMKTNPPAAGSGTDDIFIWNENAGEYHLE